MNPLAKDQGTAGWSGGCAVRVQNDPTAPSVNPIVKARLTVFNKNDKPVIVRLQFIVKHDKVIALRDANINPGESDSLEVSFVGAYRSAKITSNDRSAVWGDPPAGLRAQFGSQDKDAISLRQPTLEIIDKTGAVKTIGIEAFREFDSNSGTPLKSVDVRPGNDPKPNPETEDQKIGPEGFKEAKPPPLPGQRINESNPDPEGKVSAVEG